MKIFAYLLLFFSCSPKTSEKVPPKVHLMTCFSGGQMIYQNFGTEVHVGTSAWKWTVPGGPKVTTTVACTAVEVPLEKLPPEVLDAVTGK